MTEELEHLEPHRGGTILALGILGIVICFPLGLAAWFMGQKDVAAMDAGRMDPSGRGLVDAGRIVGLVGCLLAAIGLLFGLACGGCLMLVSAVN
ncbi:MAG: DUF4190 domain-containing protein [Planctomycetota bacterium]|nr:DUF4190 domain-containing protein [Planctomycetota bacterium]